MTECGGLTFSGGGCCTRRARGCKWRPGSSICRRRGGAALWWCPLLLLLLLLVVMLVIVVVIIRLTVLCHFPLFLFSRVCGSLRCVGADLPLMLVPIT